jgi:Tc5 transposase-like DNA-binding protein
MGPASVALSEGLEPNERRTYAALSKRHKVPRTTVWNRAHGRLSITEKAKRQQYLTPAEEKALVKYLLQMSNNGYPVPIKYLCSLAFTIARWRSSTTNEAIKPPGKNWPQAFHKRHPELKPRKVKALDWNRHDKNIYGKVTYWFEIIGPQLHDPIIKPENVYNMDETGVMLSMLSCIKVLVL